MSVPRLPTRAVLWFAVAVFLICSGLPGFGSDAAPEATGSAETRDGSRRTADRAGDEQRLRVLLDRLAEQARLYHDRALAFTCDETIEHYLRGRSKKHRFQYTYVFDERGRLSDFRVPSRRAAKNRVERGKPIQPVSPEEFAKQNGMSPVLNAYTWPNLFSPGRRKFYRFELIGESEALGLPALELRFVPVAPVMQGVNDWVGTAWVDPERYQLLKVEALRPEEQRKKEAFEASVSAPAGTKGRSRSSHLFWVVTTRYGVVENGMRFPTEVVTRGTRYEVWGRKRSTGFRQYPVARLRQSYANYRFFGVRTDERIDRVVIGE